MLANYDLSLIFNKCVVEFIFEIYDLTLWVLMGKSYEDTLMNAYI